MTPAELEAIEARVRATIHAEGLDWSAAIDASASDVEPLIAEVRRLQEIERAAIRVVGGLGDPSSVMALARLL